MRKRKESTEVKLKREELINGIFLEHFQKTIDSKNIYLLKVESQSFKVMDLTIDLRNSKNVEVSGCPDMVKKVKVEPFTKATVAKIHLGKKWTLSSKFSFKISDPPLESQRQLMQPYNSELNEKISKFKEIKNIDFKIFPQEICLSYFSFTKLNFIDLEFPPVSESLCQDPLFFETRHKLIHQWRRAKYLYYPVQKANQVNACPPVIFTHNFRSSLLKSIQKSSSAKYIKDSDPKMAVNPTENILDMEYLETEKHNIAFLSNDGLDPGVGTHDWLTVSLMAIKSHPALLKNIFLTTKPNAQGFYLLRLHIMGRKSTMQLDDYIPCLPFNGPIFIGKDSEIKPDFGFLLLEKAFAKKRGSYHKLKNGTVASCLADLTGSPVFEMALSEKTKSGIDNLWQEIEEWIKECYIAIVEQIAPEKELKGSQISKVSLPKKAKTAYFIISSVETDEHNTRIVKLSMKSKTSAKIENQEGPETLKVMPSKRDILEPTDLFGVDLSPNELPMPFISFCKNFQKLILVKTTFKEKLRLKGKFVSRSSIDNPQIPTQNFISRWYYSLQLKRATRLVIGLHQEDENWVGVKETRPNIDMGFAVFQQNKRDLIFKYYLPPNIKREVFAELNLEAGTYLVIPITLGIYNKNESLKSGITSHDKKNPIVVSVVKDIFEKLNMSANDLLAYSELKIFYKTLNLAPLSQNDFHKLIARYSHANELGVKDPEGLSENAFIELFFSLLETNKSKSSSGANFFTAFGYDETLFSVSSRIFTLTIHSDKFIDIDWKDLIKDNLEDRTMEILLEKLGKKVATFQEEEDFVYPLVLANE